MFAKGRQRNLGICKGEQHGNSKLSSEDVMRIRSEAASGRTNRSIAAEFGINESTVGYIVKRRTWRHI